MWRGLIGFLALIAPTPDDPPAPAAKVPAFRPGKPGAASFSPRLLYLDGRRQVWLVQDANDRELQFRAIHYRSRYYIQEFGGETASLVYEMRGAHHKDVVAVLSDDSLVLSLYGWITYVDPDGRSDETTLEIEGTSTRIVRGYPDGALAQPINLSKPAAVYFVPFRGRRLDPAGRVRLTDAEDVPAQPPPLFLRAGGRFAWGNRAFDMETGRRTEFPTEAGAVLRAFDGQTAVFFDNQAGGRRAFSAADGREIETLRKLDSHDRDFAVHGRVVYAFSRPLRRRGEPAVCEVKAVGLTPELVRSAVLKTISLGDDPRNGIMGMGGTPPIDPPFILTEDGPMIWDGSRWETLPWLKVPPGDEAGK